MSAPADPPPAAERTRCEVWTRVMGYHRPVSAFNAGKQSEHRERTLFREAPAQPGATGYAEQPSEDDGEPD